MFDNFYQGRPKMQQEMTKWLQRSGKVINFVFQLERCPTTSKLHYQCYIVAKKMRFTTMKGAYRARKEQNSSHALLYEILDETEWLVSKNLEVPRFLHRFQFVSCPVDNSCPI